MAENWNRHKSFLFGSYELSGGKSSVKNYANKGTGGFRTLSSGLNRLRTAFRTQRFRSAIAIAITFLLPLGSFGVGGIATLNLGILISLACLPLWFRAATSYLGARVIQALMLASIVCGLLLLLQTSTTHEIIPQRAAALPVTMLFSALTLGVLLWARQAINLASLGVAYGAGALLDSVIRAGEWGENGWKYGYAWPCAVIALSLVIGRKREPLWTLLVVAALVAVSVGGGYRSLVAFAVVAVGLYLCTLWNKNGGDLKRGLRFGMSVLAIPALAFVSLSWLLLGGALGSIAQTRTQEQIAESGSILVGGRQEWAAAVALFRQSPLGFGPGVVPNPEDVAVGKRGLEAIGANEDSYHIDTYMFGGQFRLHGIVSDLWANFGLVGLALSLVLLVAIAWFLWYSGVNAYTTGLQTLLAVWVAWDIFFSPFDSNWRYLIFALSLLLLLRKNHPQQEDRRAAFEFGQKSGPELSPAQHS
ncbi:hypothetical protein [Cryobacterium gelidum]|uniref:O-antigen ligase domain-containing protein n=1 Tax=Cryobacterium gelidum TaxID=1259164 RepID=A0A4R9AQ86_9MICO|nr:hypothetical protein [Cryobacterium gelidum]TFD66568.1 hypothetical protein E3T50_15280 [Cryobacterium gelidum]